MVPWEEVLSGLIEDLSLSILSLLLEEAMDLKVDGRGTTEGGIGLDSRFLQVHHHACQ
jgi:hypothetical protein